MKRHNLIILATAFMLLQGCGPSASRKRPDASLPLLDKEVPAPKAAIGRTDSIPARSAGILTGEISARPDRTVKVAHRKPRS